MSLRPAQLHNKTLSQKKKEHDLSVSLSRGEGEGLMDAVVAPC